MLVQIVSRVAAKNQTVYFVHDLFLPVEGAILLTLLFFKLRSDCKQRWLRTRRQFPEKRAAVSHFFFVCFLTHQKHVCVPEHTGENSSFSWATSGRKKQKWN